MARLLVVDDNLATSKTLAAFLQEDGHATFWTHDGKAAISVGLGFCPDVLIIDWRLEERQDGIDVALALRAAFPQMGIIFMTGLPADAIEGKLRGLTDVQIIEKPPTLTALHLEITTRLQARERHSA